MELRELQSHWDSFGQADPMWAVLSDPDKRGRKWEPAEFFATGEHEIAALMAELGTRGGTAKRHAALDFGCGVGRLTQALAKHFDRAVGVDIAPSMIAAAKSYNRHGDRVEYVLNDRDDLSRFPDGSFDLVYSVIVLQHMVPEYSKRYMREFVRVLAPGGLAVFGVPSEWRAIPPVGGDTPPLPESASKARIVPRSSSLELVAGKAFDLTVAVTNLGDGPWQAPPVGGVKRIRLGNHWLNATGEMIAFEDVRTDLPADVSPGQTVDIPVSTIAPTPGRYLLELDMMQEHVCWFSLRGSSATARVPVTVVPDKEAKPQATATAPFVPVMQMHAVPMYDVIREVTAAGGAIIDVTRDEGGESAGWYGYRYTVCRRG